jgi:hypothetical protein
MSGTRSGLSATVAVTFATLLLAAAGAAQDVRTKSAPPPSPAFELERNALAFLQVPNKWSELAATLEEAAALRAADDPRALQDLMFAAGARWSAGKVAAAQRTFVAAGERALSLGYVYTAAHAFLLGAVAANQANDGRAALELKNRAELLAGSPHVTAAQRGRIFAQFKGQAPS